MLQYAKIALYNVCSIPWGCSVRWGDILSTVGDIVIHMGDMMSTMGGGVFSTVEVLK